MAEALWAAAAITLLVVRLIVGRHIRGGESVLVVAGLAVSVVLATLAVAATVAAKRRRIGERLGILPPGAGLADDEEG